MLIKDINPKNSEFTEDELDAMAMLLQKAEEIRDDSALYGLIKDHIKKTTKELNSIADLRSLAYEKSKASVNGD